MDTNEAVEDNFLSIDEKEARLMVDKECRRIAVLNISVNFVQTSSKIFPESSLLVCSGQKIKGRKKRSTVVIYEIGLCQFWVSATFLVAHFRPRSDMQFPNIALPGLFSKAHIFVLPIAKKSTR